ncbi:MAG: hypothetical protein IPM55_23310 [Acidobacteria bacterium]|nr:hypothetical protein [Acidobacteriota bacterium]
MEETVINVVDQLPESDRELLRWKREVLLSAIPEIMERLGKTEVEAKRMFNSATAPEVQALCSDTWESNPQVLIMLKPETPDLIQRRIKSGLKKSAEVYGESEFDIMKSICQNPFNPLRLKRMILTIAFNRRLPSIP